MGRNAFNCRESRLTYKSEGAVHKLYCLKAWQISKVHALSREITNDPHLQGQTAKKSQPTAPRRVLWFPRERSCHIRAKCQQLGSCLADETKTICTTSTVLQLLTVTSNK